MRHTHGEHKRLFTGGRERTSVSGGRDRAAASERWKQRSAAFKRLAALQPALQNRTVDYSVGEAAEDLTQADSATQVPQLLTRWFQPQIFLRCLTGHAMCDIFSLPCLPQVEVEEAPEVLQENPIDNFVPVLSLADFTSQWQPGSPGNDSEMWRSRRAAVKQVMYRCKLLSIMNNLTEHQSLIHCPVLGLSVRVHDTKALLGTARWCMRVGWRTKALQWGGMSCGR